jgi:hypothetical protein
MARMARVLAEPGIRVAVPSINRLLRRRVGQQVWVALDRDGVLDAARARLHRGERGALCEHRRRVRGFGLERERDAGSDVVRRATPGRRRCSVRACRGQFARGQRDVDLVRADRVARVVALGDVRQVRVGPARDRRGAAGEPSDEDRDQAVIADRRRACHRQPRAQVDVAGSGRRDVPRVAALNAAAERVDPCRIKLAVVRDGRVGVRAGRALPEQRLERVDRAGACARIARSAGDRRETFGARECRRGGRGRRVVDDEDQDVIGDARRDRRGQRASARRGSAGADIGRNRHDSTWRHGRRQRKFTSRPRPARGFRCATCRPSSRSPSSDRSS